MRMMRFDAEADLCHVANGKYRSVRSFGEGKETRTDFTDLVSGARGREM